MKRLACDDQGIGEAARVISAGGLVVFPTDTVYGIGCDPLNDDAVRRLEATKSRKNKPLPILVNSLKTAEQMVTFTLIGKKTSEAILARSPNHCCYTKRVLERVGCGSPR